MSLISALVISVLILSMIMTAVQLVNALKNNYLTGQLVRKQIGHQIEQMPFGKMLQMHNVDATTLLHQASLTEIDSEIRACQSCAKTVECNKALQSDIDMVDISELSFCPNSTLIQQQAMS